MPLFDRYVIVDWSASSVPVTGKDSVWIATLGERDEAPRVVNPSTRAEAADLILSSLRESTRAGASVLVGFDFPYGYAAGFAALANQTSGGPPPWRVTWDRLAGEIKDDEKNVNNRFRIASGLNEVCSLEAGPFWGAPKSQVTARLRSTSHDWASCCLRRYRHSEKRLRDRRQGVQEAWKLFGNGSVGSQTLVGLPRVGALRADTQLKSCGAVWALRDGFQSVGVCRQKAFRSSCRDLAQHRSDGASRRRGQG